MHEQKSISTRKIVLTGLLAALTVAGSALRITMPLSIGGTTSFHLGNIMCALSGILLGPWFGGLAAGLGSMIYDMTNPLYISECWLTFLFKGVYGLMAGLVVYRRPWHYGRAVAAAAAGAISYALLYLAKSFFYNGMFISGYTFDAALISVAGKLPATIFNAALPIVCAPALALAIRKALERSRLQLD